jgi:hypothetical protein
MSETPHKGEADIDALFRGLREEYHLELVDQKNLAQVLRADTVMNQLTARQKKAILTRLSEDGGIDIRGSRYKIPPTPASRRSLGGGILRPMRSPWNAGLPPELPFYLEAVSIGKIPVARESQAYRGLVSHSIEARYRMTFLSEDQPYRRGVVVRDKKVRIYNLWKPAEKHFICSPREVASGRP